MKIGQEIAKIRARYRAETTKRFEQWIRMRFGRALKKGDILVPTGKDGFRQARVYRVKGVVWDYSTPAVEADKRDIDGSYHSVDALTRRHLKKMRFARPNEINGKAFEYVVDKTMYGRNDKRLTTTRCYPTLKAALAAFRKACREWNARGGRADVWDEFYATLYTAKGNTPKGGIYVSRVLKLTSK